MSNENIEREINYNQDNKVKKLNADARERYFTLGSRVPPHSTDAEMAVLGGMIMSNKAIPKAINILERDKAFYHEKHNIIFKAIVNLFNNNVTVDLLTLKEELKRLGKHDAIGGDKYLLEINRRTPSSANVEQHALIVLDKYLKRSLIEVAGEILERAYDDTVNVVDEIDRAENEIFRLGEARISKEYMTIKELSKHTYDILMKQSERKGIAGIPSGFKHLDEMLGGFQNSDLIIIAARPSMGKTALGLSILLNTALYRNIPTAFFSIEMAAHQIAIRLVSADARINQQNIRNNKMNMSEHAKMVKSFGDLADAPIIIDDTAMLTINELRAKCRRLKAQNDIKLIIVDYLQIMHATGAESREREISIISANLKQIAKELEIPVIALAQLNRNVESRKEKNFRPMLQDLRESGSIEQDADVIMFVNRPERYGVLEFEDGTSTQNMGELIIGKQRNGPIGTVRVAFNSDYARFEDYTLAVQDQPQSMRENYARELENIDPNLDDDAPF